MRPLPQEIIDRIIDESRQPDNGRENSAQNRATLFAWTLVSRPTYSRATHHLFSKVEITDNFLWGVNRSTGRKEMTKRLEDLLDLLSNNSELGSHIHTFRLEFHSIGGPLFEGDDLWITEDPSLSHILPHLSHIRHLSLNNQYQHGKFNFSNFSQDIISAFIELGKSPYLTSMEFRNIHEFPIQILTACPNLKDLQLHCIPNLLSQSYFIESQTSLSLSFPFTLDSAIICGADSVVSALIEEHSFSSGLPSSKVFSRLRTLSIDLLYNNHRNISTSWTMMLQASQTLESLNIPFLVCKTYLLVKYKINNFILDSLPSPSIIDLGVFLKLRSIDINCSFFSGIGMSLPPSLNTLFGLTGVPSKIETINIVLSWGDVVTGEEKVIFQPSGGWSDLDNTLASSKYPALKKLTVTLKLGYIWFNENDIDGEKEKSRPYVDKIFPTIRASDVIQYKVLITPHHGRFSA